VITRAELPHASADFCKMGSIRSVNMKVPSVLVAKVFSIPVSVTSLLAVVFYSMIKVKFNYNKSSHQLLY
jgi:hypothetical protein